MRVLASEPIGNSCQIHQVLPGPSLALGQTFRAAGLPATIHAPPELVVEAPPLLLHGQIADGLKQSFTSTFNARRARFSTRRDLLFRGGRLSDVQLNLLATLAVFVHGRLELLSLGVERIQSGLLLFERPFQLVQVLTL